MVYCKKIIILFLLIFFVFCSFSYCATEVNPTEIIEGLPIQYDNQYLTLYEQQYTNQSEFISYIYANFDKPLSRQAMQVIYSQFSQYGLNGKFIYIGESLSETHLFSVRFGFVGGMTSTYYNYRDGVMGHANVPFVQGTVYNVIEVYRDNITFPDSPLYVEIPYAKTQVVHPGFVQLFKDYGFIRTESDLSSSILSAIQQTKDTVNDVKNSVDKVDESINKLDEDITNDEVDVEGSIGSLPTDTSVDITESGFNNIFEMFYNTFTGGEGQSIVINIPFVNKSFTISFNTLFGSFPGISTITDLANMFWYFLISSYIVKDIGKRFEKIKSGDVENVVNSNVKEDLL